MGTWKCRLCGYELIPGKKYCSRCGAPTIWSLEKSDTEQIQKKDSVNEQNDEERKEDGLFRKIESESVDADEEIGEEEERYKKGAIVFGICMGLILFGAVMSPFMAESANKNVKSTNVSSEIVLEKNSRKNAESELTEDKNTESVQTEAQSTESLVSEYILAGSDSRYITREEIENLSLEECRLARNELYARRGRYFSDKELQDYFNACSWYEPYIQPEDFQDSVFNQYELANRDLLLQYERELN